MHLGGLVTSRRELAAVVSAVVVWSALMVGVGGYAFRVAERSAESLALHQSRTLFNTITDFRRWASQHGGVYIPTSDAARPNIHLPAHKRVIHDDKGRELMLVNPSLMTRQAAELISKRREGVLVHLTSLHPLRPQNAPRAWERSVLKGFERGSGAYSGFLGEKEYRFMAPMVTEKSCLSCHAQEPLGAVRGGLSITTGAQPFVQMRATQERNAVVVLSVIWLLGMTIIAFFVRVFRRRGLQLFAAEEAAYHDPLTSLRNRRGFFSLAPRLLSQQSRVRDEAGLLFIDVDAFKELNDVHGHNEGDAALQRIGELLLEIFRDTDIVARLGGDEFVVLMLQADEAECVKARERLALALERVNSTQRTPYELSLSVGMVAFRPSEGRSLHRLMEEADRAMYHEKRSRRLRGGGGATSAEHHSA
ncbi:MAG: diguanylate cyclase [Deltaproteobacteria bacterium]|nr:diguanylate cyclase [Deltaproteobacteria bacterium]